DTKGAPFGLAWFGNPDPADRLRLVGHGQGARELEALGRREALEPIHPSGLLPAIVLGDLPDGEVPGGSGRDQQALQSVDGLRVATLRGFEDALLELVDGLLQLPPRQAVPFIR